MTTETTKKRPANGASKSAPNKRPKFDPAKSKPTNINKSKYQPKGAGKGPSKPGQKNVYGKTDSKAAAAAKPGANPFEKQDWNKFKQEKKELKLKRKQGDNKDLFELTIEAKKVYEELRCKTTGNKEPLATKLFELLRGAENFQKLVLAHDTARIVQCLLKHSPVAIRTEIGEYLVDKVPEMSVSKYAHFCVLRLIKYGTNDIKSKVIEALYGNVLRLCNNRFASEIIDQVYVSFASSQQKAYLRQEWYGDLYKSSKDAAVKQIADTFEASPHIKLAIVNALKANLDHVVNKKLIDNSLVHAVLLEYLNVCSEEERLEMGVTFNPYIPSLASTKDGARSAIIIFFNSIVKDRRSIVKNLREHLIKLCTHEHGHVLILAIINSMDDTKALKKSVFDHIFAHIEYVAANEWGRRIIEWFVAPDDKTLFHPQIISYLDAGLINSKKDKSVRRAEISEAVEEPLCAAIAANAAFWFRGGHTGLATAAILRRVSAAAHAAASDDDPIVKRLQLAYENIAALLVQPDWQVAVKELGEKEPSDLAEAAKKAKKVPAATTATDGDAAEPEAKKKKVNPKILKKYKSPFEKEEVEAVVEKIAGIEHAGLHIVFKKILKSDGELKSDQKERPNLSAALAEKLDADTVKQWILLNRPSFLLLIAYETGSSATGDKLRALLKSNAALIKKQSHSAAKLLVKKLNL